MIRSYLIIAWRNLWKTRISSFVNIVGLSVGMMCFIAILLYVKTELSFDAYHNNAGRIYRVVKDFVTDGAPNIPDATTPPALAPALRNDMPEVAYATRLCPAWGRKYLIQYGEKSFYETNLIRIDSSFFDVFAFPFLLGKRENTFRNVQSIILTETAAKKYFGKENPIGRTLKIDVNNGQPFTVTGVLKDIPQNSHFTFDFLIPFASRRDSTINSDWGWHIFYTYALLKPNANAAAFANKVQPLFKRYQPDSKNIYYTQSLTDIHLHSNLKWELGTNSDLSYIRILIAIAILVIVIAGINYVNLITAESLKRAKEVGVRKVTGATKRMLITQFLIASVCTAFVALMIAVVGLLFILPFFSQLMKRDLSIIFSGDWLLWLELTAITLLIGLTAGLYPALYFSSFQPIKALKGKFMNSRRGVYFRKSMVVFQFSISIILISGFITIYRQVDFITQKNVGFNKDNVLLIPNERSTGRQDGGPGGSWLDDLRSIPAVTNIAKADGVLGGSSSTNGVSTRGKRNHILLNFIRVDHAFLPTLEIGLKEGRNFFEKAKADSSAIILNEKAVEQLGLKKPYLGQQLEWDDEDGSTHPVTIVGIAKNFHFTSMHEEIKPFGFLSEENNGSTFFVKLHTQSLSKDLAAIQKAWSGHNPDKPFDFTFLDEQTAKQYQYDIRFRDLFSGVTLLAVLIACLGLFGLSVFTAEARSKEISIRKVMGATAGSLFALLSKEFFLLIMVAFIAALPIAWLAMHNWLQSFAYRVNMGWWIFPVAGGTAMIVTLATVSFHTIKAVLANPAKRLSAE